MRTLKETGLPLKAPMVRAILEGRKTQTRRIAKPVRHPDLGNVYSPGALVLEHEPQHVINRACPCGQPGDRIYVRETWQGPLMSSKEWEDHYFSEAEELPSKFHTTAYCQYAADGGPPPEFTTMDDELVARWKPSIHMPKWAARIWLEVTGVRVERLQDISESDCLAEGIVPWYSGDHTVYMLGPGDTSGAFGRAGSWEPKRTPKEAFRTLWESTGGDWAANPWVWVVDFKVLSTTGRPA